MKIFPENFPAEAALAGGIGATGSILFAFALLRFSQNTSVYVGQRRIRKRRVKLTKEGIALDLSKEFIKANGDDLKVILSASLSRKIAGRSITILEHGNILAQLIAPEFSGGPLVIEVETPGI